MNCETARELAVGALVDGQPGPLEVQRHLAACQDCREEIEGVVSAWRALDALPMLQPPPSVGRRLDRRLKWERLREALGSVESWRQAALGAAVGFVVSVALGLAIPYQVMVDLCRDAVATLLPTPFAYGLAGVLYGLLPVAIGTTLNVRRARFPVLAGVAETPLLFFVLAAPYLVLACREFPVALLTGFLAGIAVGAVTGGAAVVGFARAGALHHPAPSS